MDSIRSGTLILILLLTSAAAHSDEVKRDAWMNKMSTALPSAFCISGQFFRECFEVSQDECEGAATSAVRFCLQKYKDQIPKVLIQPKDGGHWGKIIDDCTVEAYEKALQTKRISNSKCNDPSHWR